jgi:hypothetical protein
MIRKFKGLSLALVAVLAMSAFVASAASAASFTSVHGKTPVALTGKSTNDVFTYEGSTVSCTNNTFTGTVSTTPTSAVTITPSYLNCTALGFPATVTAQAGAYEFTADQTVHIRKGFTIHIYSSSSHTTKLAEITVPAQTPTTQKLKYSNVGSGTTSEVNISGSVEGIHAHYHRLSFLAPNLPTETKTAKYAIQTGGINVTGTVGGAHEGIHWK